MASSDPRRFILFDLDNTLFDHHHSLRCAITAVQQHFTELKPYKQEDLITKYNTALQTCYDQYLNKETTYEATELTKVQLFFSNIGLPKPSIPEAEKFRSIYRPAYRNNRRATPGSIETLIQLRGHGYPLAIVTNGQTEDQVAKAEAIGVLPLIDKIFTSEEAGCCKPNSGIFNLAIKSMGGSEALIVGDSVDADIKGAIAAGLDSVLYSPMTSESEMEVEGKVVPVIQHMNQLLGYLNISDP